jgi:hypothetical protein
MTKDSLTVWREISAYIPMTNQNPLSGDATTRREAFFESGAENSTRDSSLWGVMGVLWDVLRTLALKHLI